MLKNLRENNQGYILLESCVALSIVTLLISGVLPLIMFVENQRLLRGQKLEMSRYLYEVSLGIRYGKKLIVEKDSEGGKMVVQVEKNQDGIRSLTVIAGTQHLAISFDHEE